MDVWNPQSFDDSLRATLEEYSDLIAAYQQETQDLMDRHINSDPYESLQPNKYASQHQNLLEFTITPLLRQRRIRVRHYTRLLDDEAEAMKKRLEPSSLASLKSRVNNLVQTDLLTKEEAEIIYGDSPFHAQEDSRSGRLYSVIVPIIPQDNGVEPLLKSWGGEASHFWLQNKTIAAKLKTIGKPRIVEIETALRDDYNAYDAAKTVLQSWARNLGVSISPSNTDMAIKDCLSDAKILRIHTRGDNTFAKVAKSYPYGYENI